MPMIPGRLVDGRGEACAGPNQEGVHARPGHTGEFGDTVDIEDLLAQDSCHVCPRSHVFTLLMHRRALRDIRAI